MRDEVIERDGDLEELFRSPRFRDPEVMALVTAYHLAWVRYQGAQLVGDAAKKRALLQKAVEGFSQFLLVNEVPEIYADSLYGRGLAFLDLGETGKAIEDLSAAAGTPQVGAKARAALEEAQRRASRKAPSEDGPQVLLARLGELLPRVATGDAAAEKDATALARGLAARGGPWPARVSSLPAERLGGGPPARVHPTHRPYLLAERRRARGACKRAQAEYAQVGPGPFAARAHLGDLECRVAMLGKGNEGRKEVLAALRAFARDAAEKGLGARAALLGAVVAAGATPPDQGAVVELLDGFEKHYPDAKEIHPRALELRLAARVATRQLEEAARDLDALTYWRTVLDASPPGGTAWYEARVAQVTLLAEDGQKAQACALLRAAHGRATSTGGDQLEARLRAMEPRVCE